MLQKRITNQEQFKDRGMEVVQFDLEGRIGTLVIPVNHSLKPVLLQDGKPAQLERLKTRGLQIMR